MIKNLILREGGHPDLFVKLIFKIAVAHGRCPQCGYVHVGSHFAPIVPNHLNILTGKFHGKILKNIEKCESIRLLNEDNFSEIAN